MAAGKAMRKSFYTEGQGVQGAPHIEMPPLEESAPQKVGSVPDKVPEEVYEEMNQSEEQNMQEVGQQENPVQEIGQEETTEQDQSTTEQLPTEQETTEKKTTTPKPQDSFKAIREAKERAEQERDALMQQVMEYQKSKQAQSQPQQSEPPAVDDDINFDIDEDGLVEGRYVKKVTNRIKKLEKMLHGYESQAKQQTIESKLKSQFPDFEQVVSKENVEMLNSQFPEIASSLRDTSDLYSKAVSAYNIMKKFGIYREDPHSEERVKALKNTQKPKPLTSVSPQQGDSPLSKANAFANGLTEDLKSQLRKEMAAARRGM